ncbi:SH3 domain-containing protein, partial [Candidatus Gracilibacteria bacterium]|nr:SH3 domain-containing protein [Candidatus Gracilibacteria bacterium]
MRKLIIFLIPVFLFIHVAYATDSCEQIVLQEAEFVGEIIISANVRDYPCVNKSKVIRGSKVGERFNVVAKVDGWYKVKLDSGEIVWIRDQAMKKVGELPEELKEKKVVEEVRVIKLEAKPEVKVTESTEYV